MQDHGFKLVQPPEKFQRPQRIDHHLRIALCLDKDPFSILQVNNRQHPIRRNQKVSRPESIRNVCTQVKLLFHQHNRIRALLLCLPDQLHRERRVSIRAFLHLIRVIVRMRPPAPDLQKPLHLVLSQRMGSRPFLRCIRGFPASFLRIDQRGRRAIDPPESRGRRQNRMFFISHSAPPLSPSAPRTSPAARRSGGSRQSPGSAP